VPGPETLTLRRAPGPGGQTLAVRQVPLPPDSAGR
jgi:hypothetical protein